VQSAFGESIDQLDTEWKKSLNYPGDQGISASVNTHHDTGGSHNDLIGSFGTPALLGIAALFALGSGIYYTHRARRLRDESQPL
jgi:hypothetical protein